MSVLPRANGQPDRETAEIIDRIRGYARQPASDNFANNVQHVRNVHHIFDAAQDALNIALAIANQAGPGKVSYRDMDPELGLHKDTAASRVPKGRALLAEEEAA